MSVKFTTIENGIIVSERTISREAMRACPHCIMVADHYREDESCRCDDPSHTEMIEWEYKWNGSKWITPWDEEQ